MIEKISSVSASYIYTAAGDVIRGGVMRMRGGVIEAVGSAREVAKCDNHLDLAGGVVGFIVGGVACEA